MGKKVKVWEVIPTLGGGGAEKLVLDLAKNLRDYDYDITVISLYGPEFAANNRIEYSNQNKIKVLYLYKKRGFDVRLLIKIIRLIKKEKPAIIHTHIESFQYFAILGFVQNFNHIHTMHSVVGRESKIYQSLLKIVSLKKSTFFVVLSNSIKDDMIAIYGTSVDRIKCIPNGIDSEYYKFKQRIVETSNVTFITVGSLIPVKNQTMLINSFYKINNVRKKRDKLYILGDGFLKEELKIKIRNLNLEQQVKLIGNVPNVRDYLYEADIFVMTSHYEGVSLALLEAASTGLPIIVTNTGNTFNVVEDDALLIKDNDENGLVKAMLELANNSDLRKKYINKSKNISYRFDGKKMISCYAKLYSELLTRKR